MSHYRKVDVRIWNDEKFRALSDDGRSLFLLILTHPHMTSLGAMRASAASLADDLRWPAARTAKAFRQLLAQGLVAFDRSGPIVALPNFLKYNAPENPNVLKSWVKSLDLLPACALKTTTLDRLRSFVEGLTEPFRKAFDEAFRKAFDQASPNPSPNTYPKQEHEQEQEKKEASHRATTEDQDCSKGRVIAIAGAAR